MRGLAIGVALTGAVILVVRKLAPTLHARVMAGCEHMFEQMPDDFPPKRMMRGIEEIRASSARTLALLEERTKFEEGVSVDDASSTRTDEIEVVHA